MKIRNDQHFMLYLDTLVEGKQFYEGDHDALYVKHKQRYMRF